MMKPTMFFRQVNDSSGIVRMEQWYEVEGYEHPDFIVNGGMWESVPIVNVRHSTPEDSAPSEWERSIEL